MDILEIERKWLLLEPPTPRRLATRGARVLDITQTYLTRDEPGVHRLRHTLSGRIHLYEKVTKIKLAPGVNDERTSVLTAPEYRELLEFSDPARATIKKIRFVLPLDPESIRLFSRSGVSSPERLKFEFDYFQDPLDLRMLEIEFASSGDLEREILLPPWLGATKEVTGEPRYSNASLALDGVPV